MSDHKKAFAKELETMARLEGTSISDAFNTWLTLACRSLYSGAIRLEQQLRPFSQAACEQKWLKNEEAFQDATRLFRNKELTVKAAARALGFLVEILEEKRADVLGEIFMEHIGSKDLGQFFTPDALSQLIAEMTIGDVQPIIKQNGFVLMSEPACGAGGMIIAASRVLRARGIDDQLRVHWIAQDVSWRACCTAYIQLSLLGISAHVLCGNTLSMEEPHQVLVTPMAVMFPKNIQKAQSAMRVSAAKPSVVAPASYADAINVALAAAE